MNRFTKTFELEDKKLFLRQLFQWAEGFDTVLWLESNQYPLKESKYEVILAVGALSEISVQSGTGFQKLQEFQEQIQDWCFGYFSYDLKNELFDLSSSNADGLNFPDLWFFQPEKLLLVNGNAVSLHYPQIQAEAIFEDINAITCSVLSPSNQLTQAVQLKARMTKEDYLNKVKALKSHIQKGDIYEVNFCMEWFQEGATIDPSEVFSQLNQLSAAPFSCFLRNKDWYAMSASPERYLMKKGQYMISQPIKGTSRRFADETLDQASKHHLINSAKERSENVMIVDLVRNDLSKVAQKGSVAVKELFGVYSFQQVHHMISTISADLKEDLPALEAIKASFPMGSMTGAPKLRAMQLIENFEVSKRGLYSGAIGYFEPNGDFDFNVAIRTILYNRSEQFVSYSVGSAITTASEAELEYEECLLKANALSRVLAQDDLTKVVSHD